MARKTDIKLAADIGGTFTDIVLEAGTRRWSGKVLTTTHAPEEGVIEGIRLVLDQSGLAAQDVGVFIHGTTLATNALIERKGARTAFITTEVVAYYADPGNHQVPQMVLFGADGKMVKRWIGWSPTVDKEMRAAIEGELGKALAPEKALAPASKSGEKTMGGPARRGHKTTQR